ncbi:uncharacterized protein N0V89_004053 [Didymosphaeria variabile]|uniref:Uncharacterized protein n=1 Tax=Didymosphaeria variabile TaxID=1932322 RepID=A0A9W8XQH2_9PLEO|nr:uncharacterized protein N0V89_004053 [Didymosphaeria variabile]KAJ4356026.1 hypothetical protein N0V89_004053 [Didymosphaeria variabile]
MPRKPTKPTKSASSRGSVKRAAPVTPSRQSKRAKSTTKTSYAEAESDDDMERPSAAPSDEDTAAQSDYEQESVADPSSQSDPDVGSDEDNQVETTPRGRSAKRATVPVRKKEDGGEELWKSGAKLELGTQVIIKKPKAREAGDTPFTDDTIHPNTMLFLSDLAAHNDRQWLKASSSTAMKRDKTYAKEHILHV